MAESMEGQPPTAYSATAFGRLGGQPALAGALLALSAAAWVATDLRMAGMDAGPGTDPGAFGFFLSTWVVMMAAMMLPAVTPMVLAYREIQYERRGHRANASAGNTALLLVGYLLVWAAAGLLAYALFKVGRSVDGRLFAWDRAGALRRRRRARSSRALSAHPVQERVPEQMPKPARAPP
jgi:predicted metal-binding membrane protein